MLSAEQRPQSKDSIICAGLCIMYAPCCETHACMAESLSALVMNTMAAGFSPNTFAASGSPNPRVSFCLSTAAARVLAQVVVLLYTVWVFTGRPSTQRCITLGFLIPSNVSQEPIFKLAQCSNALPCRGYFWLSQRWSLCLLQGSSGADKAASGDVMHHLSVTTDLMISVCLELMDPTWEGRRSSGLKVYCQLRTNDSTTKVRITSFSSRPLFLSLSFPRSRRTLVYCNGQIVQGGEKTDSKRTQVFWKFRFFAPRFRLCVFLSSTPAIKIDFSSWATCEFESAAELWSTASAAGLRAGAPSVR